MGPIPIQTTTMAKENYSQKSTVHKGTDLICNNVVISRPRYPGDRGLTDLPLKTLSSGTVSSKRLNFTGLVSAAIFAPRKTEQLVVPGAEGVERGRHPQSSQDHCHPGSIGQQCQQQADTCYLYCLVPAENRRHEKKQESMPYTQGKGQIPETSGKNRFKGESQSSHYKYIN